MKKVLIIGGCGYIGSQLFLFLRDKKYKVDTVDLEWFGNRINPRNFKIDYRRLTRGFLAKYEVIILLAGYSSVQMCLDNRLPAFRNNVENFIRLLDKISNQTFIYASSSSIYGNTGKEMATEDWNSYTPANYYDLTKKEIDYYAQLSKVHYFGLRLATVNGFSPNLRVDLMINKMFDAAKKTGEIKIFNPQIFRPILGLNDFCRAAVTIIEKDGPSGFYNLASFNSNVKGIGRKAAKALRVKVQEDKQPSPYNYNFSISSKKFEKLFDFEFKDSVESIVKSLASGYSRANKTTRDKI